MVEIILNIVIRIIQTVSNLYILLIVLNVFLPYFLTSTNRFREIVDQLVQPLLTLIRRYVPPIGRFDFSPVILVILVQLITYLLVNLLASLL